MRGEGSESHQPSDMVPPADAKMQIPSCQMRFGACWGRGILTSGGSDLRHSCMPDKIELEQGPGRFQQRFCQIDDGDEVGVGGGISWVQVVSRLLICSIEAEK